MVTDSVPVIDELRDRGRQRQMNNLNYLINKERDGEMNRQSSGLTGRRTDRQTTNRQTN